MKDLTLRLKSLIKLLFTTMVYVKLSAVQLYFLWKTLYCHIQQMHSRKIFSFYTGKSFLSTWQNFWWKTHALAPLPVFKPRMKAGYSWYFSINISLFTLCNWLSSSWSSFVTGGMAPNDACLCWMLCSRQTPVSEFSITMMEYIVEYLTLK